MEFDYVCKRVLFIGPAAAYLDCGCLFGLRRLFRIELPSRAWRRFCLRVEDRRLIAWLKCVQLAKLLPLIS